MTDGYIYLDRATHPNVPHYFEDYEGLAAFFFQDQRRRTDRSIVIALINSDQFTSTSKHTEFYPAGMWYDAHVLNPDTSLAAPYWLRAYQYYERDDLHKLLDARRIAADYEIDPGDPIADDALAKVHAIDATIQRVAESMPGFYLQHEAPGTLIPKQACYAHLLPNGIRFESHDCDTLMHINTDASEYFSTRAEIEAHWMKIEPAVEATGCPEVQTYETEAPWIG